MYPSPYTGTLASISTGVGGTRLHILAHSPLSQRVLEVPVSIYWHTQLYLNGCWRYPSPYTGTLTSSSMGGGGTRLHILAHSPLVQWVVGVPVSIYWHTRLYLNGCWRYPSPYTGTLASISTGVGGTRLHILAHSPLSQRVLEVPVSIYWHTQLYLNGCWRYPSPYTGTLTSSSMGGGDTRIHILAHSPLAQWVVCAPVSIYWQTRLYLNGCWRYPSPYTGTLTSSSMGGGDTRLHILAHSPLAQWVVGVPVSIYWHTHL